MENQRIFIVDDDPEQVKLARDFLMSEGFEVDSSSDPLEAMARIQQSRPSLILLDIRMPRRNGIEVCKDLKSDPKTKQIPIIFLSTKSSEVDVVLGLELGADDYIRKPFLDRELAARVRAVLRRHDTAPRPETWRKGPLEVDHAGYSAKIDGVPITLRRREFELLAFFFKREGMVLTRSIISEGVWGREYLPTSRTLDFHVKELRKALGPHADWIKSIRGIGYRFEMDH